MVAAGRCLVIALVVTSLACAAELSYWVEPCERPQTGCHKDDPALARWAMEAWQAASGGKLKVAAARDKESAQIRFYWITTREGLYGETRGGDIYVRPEPGDGLLRETTVYLTCVHEAGHALGLSHTANFADIMYNFQYGGDIAEYFGRFVRKLTKREDIPKHTAISPNDRAQLLRAFP